MTKQKMISIPPRQGKTAKLFRTSRMSFYELMDRLDKICIEESNLDFRKLDVYCNKIGNKEVLLIKNKDKIIDIIVLH